MDSDALTVKILGRYGGVLQIGSRNESEYDFDLITLSVVFSRVDGQQNAVEPKWIFAIPLVIVDSERLVPAGTKVFDVVVLGATANDPSRSEARRNFQYIFKMCSQTTKDLLDSGFVDQIIMDDIYWIMSLLRPGADVESLAVVSKLENISAGYSAYVDIKYIQRNDADMIVESTKIPMTLIAMIYWLANYASSTTVDA